MKWKLEKKYQFVFKSLRKMRVFVSMRHCLLVWFTEIHVFMNITYLTTHTSLHILDVYKFVNRVSVNNVLALFLLPFMLPYSLQHQKRISAQLSPSQIFTSSLAPCQLRTGFYQWSNVTQCVYSASPVYYHVVCTFADQCSF